MCCCLQFATSVKNEIAVGMALQKRFKQILSERPIEGYDMAHLDHSQIVVRCVSELLTQSELTTDSCHPQNVVGPALMARLVKACLLESNVKKLSLATGSNEDAVRIANTPSFKHLLRVFEQGIRRMTARLTGDQQFIADYEDPVPDNYSKVVTQMPIPRAFVQLQDANDPNVLRVRNELMALATRQQPGVVLRDFAYDKQKRPVVSGGKLVSFANSDFGWPYLSPHAQSFCFVGVSTQKDIPGQTDEIDLTGEVDEVGDTAAEKKGVQEPKTLSLVVVPEIMSLSWGLSCGDAFSRDFNIPHLPFTLSYVDPWWGQKETPADNDANKVDESMVRFPGRESGRSIISSHMFCS